MDFLLVKDTQCYIEKTKNPTSTFFMSNTLSEESYFTDSEWLQITKIATKQESE